MKGDKKVLDTLNNLLADELTAINQYIVHGEINDDWGYEKISKAVEQRAIGEMKHAEKLIKRILFLEGMPIVTNLKKISIGAKLEKQYANDKQAEEMAIKAYNDAIALVTKAGDNGTADLLKSILADEEAHIDWIEAQEQQISQMGLATYLTEQIS
ncbi:MAG: bacterioferritin [Candidatus Omnitrophota bacterium]